MDLEAKDVEAGGETIHHATSITKETDVSLDELKRDIPPDRNVGTLKRNLKSRHIQFLALSGAIGTGLFVGSGQILSLAGPLSAFLAYTITGFNLYCVMQCLGEMSTYLPVSGAVPVYAARYVDDALGFTLSWNYWYQLAIGVPIECVVGAIVIKYWPGARDVPDAALVTMLFVAMIVTNLLPVRWYGELEFVFGAIKLTTILGLILLMLIITSGGAPEGGAIGFRYWHNPGAMLPYLETGALGRFLAFWKVFIQATFAYGGSEMVVIAAGETENPRRNIPKAMRRVFWRILLFYVLAIFLVGLCVSARDPQLLNAIDKSAPGAAASPFVIAIQNGGISVLPSIINAVILTSAWSAGNSFFYSSTRVLYSAAVDGKAPRILTFERFGVPYACVAVTSGLGCLVYLNVSNSSSEVFFWISNLSAVSTLLVWGSICITYLRFRAGLRWNGIERASLPYTAPLQPFLAWFCLCFCSVVAFFNGFDAFFPGRFSAKTFVPPYIDIPIFACLFLGYKLVMRTRFVRVSHMDLWSGKERIDELESTWIEPVPRNFVESIWMWLA